MRLTWAGEAVDVPESTRPTGLVPPDITHPFTVADEARLRSVLERARADVVVTTTPRLLAMASHLAPEASSVLHHVARLDPRDAQTRLLLSTFGARADVVTVLDDDVAQWVRDLLAPVAPKVVVVPHLLGPGWRPAPSPPGPASRA